MAQEITVHSYCDNTVVHGENRVTALEMRVPYWLEGTLVEFDLCQPCHDSLINPVEVIAREFGVRVDSPPPKAPSRLGAGTVPRRHGPRVQGARKLPCLFCTMDYTSNAGLLMHYHTAHELPEKNMNMGNIYGAICPVCGETSGNLGLHAKNRHDMATATLFSAAEANSDPFGMVMAAKERLKMLVEVGKQPAPQPA